MAKISLCLEPVLEKYSIYDRIRIAADAGYQAVEFWDPSAVDVGKFAQVAAACAVQVAGCTLNEPRVYQLDRPTGPVLENVKKSLAIAAELGCPSLIGLSSDVSGRLDAQKNIIIENLKRVAPLMENAGVTLLLEPLNSLVDHRGCYLDSSLVGFEMVKCTDSPNVRLLYDIYHMQIMEGNLIANISENIGLIGHFHSAGVPGRHEPMDSEVNYPAVLRRIDDLGYNRYVGLEYWSTYDDERSIGDCLAYMTGA